MRTPAGSIREKFAKIDWLWVTLLLPQEPYLIQLCIDSGNLIIIAGTTLAILGLTWGGTKYPWDSAHVLVPLILGLALIGVFVVYEAYVPKVPTIPFKVLNNRTTYSG